jgi:hypothetical protein
MAQYRKKPVLVEAVQFTGDNFDEIAAIAGGIKYPRMKVGVYVSRGTRPGELTLHSQDAFEAAHEPAEGQKGEYYGPKVVDEIIKGLLHGTEEERLALADKISKLRTWGGK